MSETTSGLVERADRRGGLTIEMEDLKPINIVVGSNVYIKQNEDLIYMTREAAVKMAWTILASVEPIRNSSEVTP